MNKEAIQSQFHDTLRAFAAGKIGSAELSRATRELLGREPNAGDTMLRQLSLAAQEFQLPGETVQSLAISIRLYDHGSERPDFDNRHADDDGTLIRRASQSENGTLIHGPASRPPDSPLYAVDDDATVVARPRPGGSKSHRQKEPVPADDVDACDISRTAPAPRATAGVKPGSSSGPGPDQSPRAEDATRLAPAERHPTPSLDDDATRFSIRALGPRPGAPPPDFCDAGGAAFAAEDEATRLAPSTLPGSSAEPPRNRPPLHEMETSVFEVPAARQEPAPPSVSRADTGDGDSGDPVYGNSDEATRVAPSVRPEAALREGAAPLQPTPPLYDLETSVFEAPGGTQEPPPASRSRPSAELGLDGASPGSPGDGEATPRGRPPHRGAPRAETAAPGTEKAGDRPAFAAAVTGAGSVAQADHQPAPAKNDDPGTRELRIGDTLKDRFLIESVLGSGGMGMVFKARDQRKAEARDRNPYVAVKVIGKEFRDNPESLIALQREARKAQSLAHPNVVTVYDFDRDGPHVFMSMECLDGAPLDKLIRHEYSAGLAFKQAWPLIDGMAQALKYAHQKGIVHSDFKPGNVFVAKDGSVKVLDFGIACASKTRGQTRAETTLFDARSLGALTPAYASCEMINREPPDPSDDIYALACVSYELLTGRHPFGLVPANQARESGLKPAPVKGLSRRQWRALARGLAFSREDRISSVGDFLTQIQPRGTFPLPIAAGIATALVVVGMTVGFLLREQAAPPIGAPAATSEAVRALDPQTLSRIQRLLEDAQAHFLIGRLTEPTGSNAWDAYRRVLDLDPDNQQAHSGLVAIADRFERQARARWEAADVTAARDLTSTGLRIVPSHPGLLDLKERVGL